MNETESVFDVPPPEPESETKVEGPPRSWLLRRFCSQNPFYLLSVCFVLQGTAHWFHTDTGAAFSPWPLLGLTTAYTVMLALTGFVIVKFGRVWDDARSILLIILLMFVELSMIFDENLVRDPANGRTIVLICWTFAIVVSESLLIGLRIVLPVWFRLPYHGLLALLFLYPLALIPWDVRLSTATVLWRIFLFPTFAAMILLLLIPAIRRGTTYTSHNGTPWAWPWYPWSLFVFLGVCVCFRAYALSLSFDPVLGETLASALEFYSTFGIYFLTPIAFASGMLLMEIGLVEQRQNGIRLALVVPVVCFWMSIPAHLASGPYQAFLRTLIEQIGSPVWLASIGAVGFYGFAFARQARFAEPCLAISLLMLSRIGPNTVDAATLTATQSWPLVLLIAIELTIGLWRRQSNRVLFASIATVVGLQLVTNAFNIYGATERFASMSAAVTILVLLVGATFQDDFAQWLRIIGAPMLIAAAIAGCVVIRQSGILLPAWGGPAYVVLMASIAFGYSFVIGMPLYRLASLISATGGSLCLFEMAVTYLIRESGWRGGPSFVIGIACFGLAFVISSCKAGWLRILIGWMRQSVAIRSAASS